MYEGNDFTAILEYKDVRYSPAHVATAILHRQMLIS